MKKNSNIRAVALGVVAIIVGVGCLINSEYTSTVLAQVTGSARRQVSPSLAKAYELSDAFREVSKRTLPAVVSIRTTGKVVRRDLNRLPSDLDPLLRGLMRDPRIRGMLEDGAIGSREYRTPSGQGSGFIIDSNGIVLTNAHVVDGAGEVIVRLADGREFPAVDVNSDARADVAVLRIDVDEHLPALPLGNDEQMEIGDWVLAFGSPFGMHRSVTQGIISAKGRGLAGDGKEFLQTDAAINPGNSGGPLVNLRGEVIGINTAISTRSGGYDGVSLAIPVNLVSWVADQLKTSGAVKRAYVGIRMQEIDAALAEELSLPIPEGVAITEVVPQSPADQAGFKPGDVILEVNGRRIRNPLNMMGVVERLTVGESYDITVQRDGAEHGMRIVAAQRPDILRPGKRLLSPSAGGDSMVVKELGIAVQNLTPEIAQQLGLENSDGVVITDVRRGDRADELGLEPGMVIASVANRPVNSVEDLASTMEISRENGRILLLVKKSTGRASISKYFSVPITGSP